MFNFVNYFYNQVYTFGCNDDGALGRITSDDDECYLPGKIDFKDRIIHVSAGDSHTAALTQDGRVFICGTFRVRLCNLDIRLSFHLIRLCKQNTIPGNLLEFGFPPETHGNLMEFYKASWKLGKLVAVLQ